MAGPRPPRWLPITKTFTVHADAIQWARTMEVKADRHDLPGDTKQLQGITLADLVKRYRDEVSTDKRGKDIETVVLNAFLRHPICQRRLSDLTTEDFAKYRDERLRGPKGIKAISLKRQLNPLHNLFEVARAEWNVPVRANPLSALKLKIKDGRRERRLMGDEFERLMPGPARLATNWSSLSSVWLWRLESDGESFCRSRTNILIWAGVHSTSRRRRTDTRGRSLCL